MDLKSLIRRSGFRQRYLAEQIGITDAMLSQSVTGKRELAMNEIAALASLLHTTADQIIAAAQESRRVADGHGNLGTGTGASP